MNILFLTLLDFKNMSKKGIYYDFVNELKNKGHNVTVVSPVEKRNDGQTELIKDNGIEILKVRINDVTKTSFVKKGINTLLVEKFYNRAIKKYLVHHQFDLIIYTTPPITFNGLVKKLKSKYNAKTYLLLKDIFPQNAVDLKLFSKKSPIYLMFRNKEKKLYRISDFIGAMSQANLDFIMKHNKISAEKQIIRNAMYEQDFKLDSNEDKLLRTKYGLSEKKILLYGGNLGIPQGVKYIAEVMRRFHEIDDAQLVIVGNGTHAQFIKDKAEAIKNDDIHVMDILPKEEYDQLVALCDVGLIFLDHRFTIPNYPSRLTSLLNAGKPILAATDKHTDIGSEIVSNGAGLWNESNDVDAFIKNANSLLKSDQFDSYRKNAYKFYEREFKIEDNINNLMNLVQGNKKNPND